MKWELELELEPCRRHNGGLGFAIEITTQYIIAPAAFYVRVVFPEAQECGSMIRWGEGRLVYEEASRAITSPWPMTDDPIIQ